MVVFSITVATHMRTHITNMILRKFISLRGFTVYMENSLRLEISHWSNWPKQNLQQSLFYLAWTHVNANNKLLYTGVKFYPEVKSQTGLSLLRGFN